MSSVTQTAAAFQRNTRPITQDEPLPVYGQETVRTVPLPHYHPGKVSFIVHPSVKTTTKFYNLLDALTDSGPYVNVQGLPALEILILSLSKNRQIRILQFSFWTQTSEEGFISWSKRIFPFRTTVGNHERAL